MKRKQKEKYKAKALKPSVKKHLRSLNMSSEYAYFAWCTRNHFLPSYEKSKREMAAECKAQAREQKSLQSQARLHHNPEQFLRDACLTQLDLELLHRPGWREIGDAIANSNRDKKQRQQLLALLVDLHQKTKLVFETTTLEGQSVYYIQALIALNNYRSQWIRQPKDWTPNTHNIHGQFSSLLEHLFVQYEPVPAFMDAAWLRTDKCAKTYRQWYLHLAAGQNMRRVDVGVAFTKKMARHFVQAPSNYSIEAAINWAHIHALGGDRRLVEAVSASRIKTKGVTHPFWAAVVRFFIEHPMLDRVHVAPIADYLQVQKFAVREYVTGPGVLEKVLPPQPTLSMRGRTPDALLNQVARWHGRLAKSSTAENVFFKKSGIPEFRKKVGEKKEDAWQIRELLSGAALVLESRKMGHCVSTYAEACASGHCSIWALEYVTLKGTQKRQTIEVDRSGMIVQCRGKLNRYPTRAELSIIKQWSHAAGLSLSVYVARSVVA